MSYGTFESLDHEGYHATVAAENREETLDRAAARVMENVGDYFRNATSRADFFERWSFAEKEVRKFIALETSTTDENVHNVCQRVAALTPTARNKTASLTWEGGSPGFDTDGNPYPTTRAKGSSGILYVIAPDDEGTYILTAIEGSTSTIFADGFPEQECKEIAEEYEQTKTAANKAPSGRSESRRKSASGDLNWIAEEGFEFSGWNAALPGTSVEDEIGYSILEMDGRYSVYYENEPKGQDETLADGSITSLDEAKALAEGHYQNSKMARTATLQWRENTPDVFTATISGHTFTVKYRDSDGFWDCLIDGENVGIEETDWEGKNFLGVMAKEYAYATRMARRKGSFNSYTDWSDFSGGGETGYIVDTSDGGTYYVVTTDGASWSVYFEPLAGDMETVVTDISDPDVAKAWAGHHQFKRLPNAYGHRKARRKRASGYLKWNRDTSAGGKFAYGGYFQYVVKGEGGGTYKADAMYNAFASYMGPGYRHPIKSGVSLDEAKKACENFVQINGLPGAGSGIYWTDEGGDNYTGEGSEDYDSYTVDPQGGSWKVTFTPLGNEYPEDLGTASSLEEGQAIAERHFDQYGDGQSRFKNIRTGARHSIARRKAQAERIALLRARTNTARRKSAGLRYETIYGDYSTQEVAEYNGQKIVIDRMGPSDFSVLVDGQKVGHERTEAEAKALAEKTVGFSTARKQAWAVSDDGMTYTSNQVQDSFDCPTCGSGNKLGFSRCACGKQWNSYSINTPNGGQKMIAREVEARPEAVLANRRRQARRKRAASEWFQRGNSERIELPGGVWCEVSEMSGKPGGPYSFIYGDGESVSGHVYDIGFPTMEQAKAAALDEVGFGGITATRRRQARRKLANTTEQVNALDLESLDGMVGKDKSQYMDNKGRILNLYIEDVYAELVDSETSRIVVNFDSPEEAAQAFQGVSKTARRKQAGYALDWDDYGDEERSSFTRGSTTTFYYLMKDTPGTYSLWVNESGTIGDEENIGTFNDIDQAKAAADKHSGLTLARRHASRADRAKERFSRRAAQRKQAGTLQWAQDPQSPKSWSAESGQWAFDIVIGTDLWVFKDYQDGDLPISVKRYPDTDSAKRAAEDIANGNADPDQGITARRTNRAGRAQGSRNRSARKA